MQLARGGLHRPRMKLASFVLVSGLNGSNLDSEGDFVQRLVAGNGRRYQNPTTHCIHTHYAVCLGRRVLAGIVRFLFSLSILSLFVEWPNGCWLLVLELFVFVFIGRLTVAQQGQRSKSEGGETTPSALGR